MRNNQENRLELKLQRLEEKQDKVLNTTQEKEMEQRWHLIKTKLDEIADHKTKGLILRPQARWHEKGEKSAKYFLQLKSRNIVKKTIKKLKREDDPFTTDRKEILQMQSDFYEKLYSKPDNVKSKTDIAQYLKSVSMPVSREEDKATCEGLLSVGECKDALQTFKNNKTPGND